MVIGLSITVGALFAILVTLMGYALAREFRGFSSARRARAACRQRRAERDANRNAKDVAAIHEEDWKGPPIDLANFGKMWKSLASYLEIRPELMRPSDKVDDLMAGADEWGPDGLDLVEFFLDFLPRSDPYAILEEVAHDENETVEDVLTAVTRRASP